MPGYSPKIPLELDHHDGFGLTQTYHELAKQNLKMLILTNPGERIMVPTFGAGVRKRLFEQRGEETNDSIRQDIQEQVERFLPYINIRAIDIGDVDIFESPTAFGESNGINIKITYNIKTLNINDELDVLINV
jgi:phage baseplate assembly protein W